MKPAISPPFHTTSQLFHPRRSCAKISNGRWTSTVVRWSYATKFLLSDLGSFTPRAVNEGPLGRGIPLILQRYFGPKMPASTSLRFTLIARRERGSMRRWWIGLADTLGHTAGLPRQTFTP